MVVKPSAKLGGLSRLNNTHFTVFCERNFLLSIYWSDDQFLISRQLLHLSYFEERLTSLRRLLAPLFIAMRTIMRVLISLFACRCFVAFRLVPPNDSLARANHGLVPANDSLLPPNHKTLSMTHARMQTAIQEKHLLAIRNWQIHCVTSVYLFPFYKGIRLPASLFHTGKGQSEGTMSSIYFKRDVLNNTPSPADFRSQLRDARMVVRRGKSTPHCISKEMRIDRPTPTSRLATLLH